MVLGATVDVDTPIAGEPQVATTNPVGGLTGPGPSPTSVGGGLMSHRPSFASAVLGLCCVFGVAVPALASSTHVLVSPVHGDGLPVELRLATAAIQTHLNARAERHDLRLMSRDTWQQMVDTHRITGTCTDLRCDVEEARVLLVDLVVSATFTQANGTTVAAVKFVDPRSGIVKASAAAEALSFDAVLSALQPALDKALDEAFPVAAAPTPRQASGPLNVTLPAPTFGVHIGLGGGHQRNTNRAVDDVGPGRQKDCRSTIDCTGRGFCKDRGDGRHVCMKDGGEGDFCTSTIDCGPRLFCKDRGDRFKVCM